MQNFLTRFKEIFTAPSMSGDGPGEEDSGFTWNQSARTVLAIVFVVASGFVMFWIMS